MAFTAAARSLQELRAAPEDLQAQYSAEDLERICDRLMGTADVSVFSCLVDPPLCSFILIT
jgi:hypothetical protein